jgi:DNA-binding transcriptional LysR family regulator
MPQSPLSQDQLEAFAAVARAGSFTRAAAALHLSQPALSRRISGLEESLEATLLVRGRMGVSLTEPGRRVLEFVEAQRAMEEELLGALEPSPAAYRGSVRIAGLSSLVPSVVLPALAPFLREHPGVQVEVERDVDRGVIEGLVRGRIDLGLSQGPSQSPGLVDVHLGDEEFVMVESRNHGARRDVFLDVSADDDTTEAFLAAQPARRRPRGPLARSFLHDEAGILLGVELGLGRAVKPRHTIPGAPRSASIPASSPCASPSSFTIGDSGTPDGCTRRSAAGSKRRCASTWPRRRKEIPDLSAAPLLSDRLSSPRGREWDRSPECR